MVCLEVVVVVRQIVILILQVERQVLELPVKDMRVVLLTLLLLMALVAVVVLAQLVGLLLQLLAAMVVLD
jgi:hypothetical protein